MQLEEVAVGSVFTITTESKSLFAGGGATDYFGDGEAVYLDSTANQISQPVVAQETKLTGEDAVVVAEWEYAEFVWLSPFVADLPPTYGLLLEVLGVDSGDYDFEVKGFCSFRHKRDPKRRCSVERIYLPVIRCGRYHPYASVKHRRRASSQALDRLEFLEEECKRRHVKFDYLLKIDLTLPKQISELWDSRKTQMNVSRAVGEFLRLLHEKLFGKRSSQFGAVANHHYWATRSPLEPHRHVHLTLPNVCYNTKTDSFHRFRPWIDEGVIKDCWWRALKKHGLWVEVPDHVRPDTWIGYIKFEDRNRVIHRLSYCCRKPVEDLVRNLIDSDLGDFDEGFAMFLLDYTPRRINLGFITNLKRFGYSRKPISLKCPICGGDMYLERDEFGNVVVYDRPPPSIPMLCQDRRGAWGVSVGGSIDY